jgi:hypothetical protein
MRMMLRTGLLGLVAVFAVAGLPGEPGGVSRRVKAESVAWGDFVTGMWELLLENLTIPLGTAPVRERDTVAAAGERGA